VGVGWCGGSPTREPWGFTPTLLAQPQQRWTEQSTAPDVVYYVVSTTLDRKNG
jgi:Uma2 family endonuclease